MLVKTITRYYLLLFALFAISCVEGASAASSLLAVKGRGWYNAQTWTNAPERSNWLIYDVLTLLEWRSVKLASRYSSSGCTTNPVKYYWDYCGISWLWLLVEHTGTWSSSISAFWSVSQTTLPFFYMVYVQSRPPNVNSCRLITSLLPQLSSDTTYHWDAISCFLSPS